MPNLHANESNCIFCKIGSGLIKSNFVEENESLFVINDINPQAQVHYLIIPKHHIVDINSMSEEELDLGADIFKMANKLAKSLGDKNSFKLVNNNGYAAGQRVFHLHVHFLANLSSSEEIL